VRGSVVKRGDGYSVVVELDRDPVTGRRRQKWHSGYRTKRDAERTMSEIVAAVHAGTYAEPTRQTLGDFVEDWLAAIEPTIRPSTHYSYARNLRLHALPRLGSVQLRRIDAGMLNGLYAELLADGKQSNGGGGLSPRSVRYATPSSTEHSGMRCAGAGSLATLPTPRTRLEPRQPRGRR
jgi:hypothetical protein